MLKRLTGQLARWITASPKRALAIAGLLVLVSLPGLFRLSTDYGVRIWFRDTDPLLKVYDSFLQTFGSDDSILMAVHNKDGLFNPQNLADIRDITEKLWKVQDVMKVESLSNFHIVENRDGDIVIEPFLPKSGLLTPAEALKKRDIALRHEQMPGYVVNREGTSALFNIRLRPLFDEQPNHAPILAQIDAIMQPYRTRAAHPLKDYSIGTAKVTETFRAVAEKDLMVMVPIMVLFVGIILSLTLRNFAGVIAVFTVIGCTVMTTMGIAGYLNIHLNNLSGVVPTVLMALCVADAMHIVMSYFQSEKDGLDRAHDSLQRNIKPTFLTSFTTFLGFVSFGNADLVPILDFSYLCAAGTIIAWIFTMLTTMPLMQLFGKDVHQAAPEHGRIGRLFNWIAEFSTTHPKRICAFFLFFTILCAWIGSRNEVNSNPFDYFSSDTELARSNRFIRKSLKGLNGLEFMVDSGSSGGIYDPEFLHKVDAFQAWINSQPYTNRSYSFVDTYKQLNRAFHDGKQEAFATPATREEAADQYLFYTLGIPQELDVTNMVSLDQRYLRVLTLWNIQQSKKSLSETKRIEDKARELGLNATATGMEYLYQGMNDYVVGTYFESIAWSLVLISLLMMVCFRSIQIGIISIIPNIVPIVFGAAMMTIMKKPIDVGTVMVASICYGLAIDDTIHFLSEFFEHRAKGTEIRPALRQVFSHSGLAMLAMTIVLVGGFGVFVFAQFIPNYNFGVLTAIVLSSGALTEFLLFPAFLTLIYGRKPGAQK